MDDEVDGLEKEVLKTRDNHILGERPESVPFLKNPVISTSRTITRTTYDVANWALEKHEHKKHNPTLRFGLGYLISIYAHALIPEHQREVARFLHEDDLSYLSKHGSTTVPATISTAEHFGLFGAAQNITLPYNLDDAAFWLNLGGGIVSTIWRQYMAFKDELESWSLTRNLAKPLRETMFKVGETLGETGRMNKYKATRWIPTFIKYTFKEGSEPTPSISLWFFLSEGTYSSGKIIAKGVKKLKEKREED